MQPTALVANLPYNVAVPALLHLLAEFPSIRTVMVMVQAEVAERLAAEPGGKDYGVPSVKVRFFGNVRRYGMVSPTVFWPIPRVYSGLVRIDRHETSPWPTDSPVPPAGVRPDRHRRSRSGARRRATRSPSGRVRATSRPAGCWPPASTRLAAARHCRSRTSSGCCSAPASGNPSPPSRGAARPGAGADRQTQSRRPRRRSSGPRPLALTRWRQLGCVTATSGSSLRRTPSTFRICCPGFSPTPWP